MLPVLGFESSNPAAACIDGCLLVLLNTCHHSLETEHACTTYTHIHTEFGSLSYYKAALTSLACPACFTLRLTTFLCPLLPFRAIDSSTS
eukprot:54306-Pelagomonas_calceolata.AAC.14